MGMMGVRVDRKRYNLDKLREGKVRVGWFDDIQYDDGVYVAQVAYWNEYGTYASPARPFMRPMLHQSQRDIKELLKNSYARAVRENSDTQRVLMRVGEEVVWRIQKQILATTTPPNSPITINGGWMRNKKSGKPFYVIPKVGTHPLIDTGVMYQTVSYQVEEVFV